MKQDQVAEENPLLLHHPERIIDENFLRQEKVIKRILQEQTEKWEGSSEEDVAFYDAEEEYQWLSWWEEIAIIVEVQIKQIFQEINEGDSIYHWLFMPEAKDFKTFDGIRLEIFRDKQLFRLNQIIEKDIESQFQNEIVKPFSVQLEDIGSLIFSYEYFEYTMPIKIKLVKNDNTLIKQWIEKIHWEPKNLHFRPWHDSDNSVIIKEAADFCLNINKKIFSDQSFFTNGWDLLHYMKNQLVDFSPHFNIEPKEEQKLNLPLKRTNIVVSFYLKAEKLFICTLTETSSHVNFTNNYGERNRIRIHRIKQDLAQKVALKNTIDNLLQQTSLQYNNLYAKHDNLGLVVKAAKIMINELYPYEFTKNFKITTNLNDETQLSKIMMVEGSLNFTWIITNKDSVLTYDNTEIKVVTLHDKIWSLLYSINTNLFDSEKNDFVTNISDLIKLLESELTKADYSFFINYHGYNQHLKDIKLQFKVYERFYDENDQYHENELGILTYNSFDKLTKFFFDLLDKEKFLSKLSS